MASIHESISEALGKLQQQELSIIHLSEPILATHAPDPVKRTSDVSADAFENPSPASLAADLSHYKVLKPFHDAIRVRLISAITGTVLETPLLLP